MSTAVAASPDRDVIDAAIVLNTLLAQLDGVDPECANPVNLFGRDYDSIAGNIAASSSIPLSRKRAASPRKRSQQSLCSPVRKRNNTTSSPVRSILAAAASVASSIANVVAPEIIAPPQLVRVPSPTSVIDTQQTNKKNKKTNSNATSKGMIGLVPKTSFLKWFRDPFIRKGDVPEKQRLKELRDHRKSMLYHFSMHGKTGTPSTEDTEDARITRSSTVDDDDDWVIDVGAAEGSIRDTRRLDRYALEQILTMPAGSRLLLIVNAEDEFPRPEEGKAGFINEQQHLPERIISSCAYY